jgi:hypothetical protein
VLASDLGISLMSEVRAFDIQSNATWSSCLFHAVSSLLLPVLQSGVLPALVTPTFSIRTARGDGARTAHITLPATASVAIGKIMSFPNPDPAHISSYHHAVSTPTNCGV